MLHLSPVACDCKLIVIPVPQVALVELELITYLKATLAKVSAVVNFIVLTFWSVCPLEIGAAGFEPRLWIYVLHISQEVTN